MKIAVAITGASGVLYGIRLLEVLHNYPEVESYLIISKNAKQIIKLESNKTIEEITALANYSYEEDELLAPLSSGSYKLDAMVIIPCSMKTLAAIANGFADNLITRAADVCLKEERKLILVIRETPLSVMHIENMLKAKKAGAIIMPASPAFYIKYEKVGDLIDFIVGRVLDLLQLEHHLYKRWGI
ncbi:MAG: UbiX family flavin prenyltransferase [Methanocellales archaeon]